MGESSSSSAVSSVSFPVFFLNWTLLLVWLYELKARNVNRRNIPAAFALLSVSLALAAATSVCFSLLSLMNAPWSLSGSIRTRMSCKILTVMAVSGQLLVRCSVWCFFIIRGSLVTSFHRYLRILTRRSPWVLALHTSLLLVFIATFVRGRVSKDDRFQCSMDFPLWLFLIGPVLGDIVYSVGFFAIFHNALRSNLLKTLKSLTTKDRIETEKHLRHNLVLFTVQLLSTMTAYIIIGAMSRTLTGFTIAEFDSFVTNLCLFALFSGRERVYPWCSRVWCPQRYADLLRQDEVMAELRRPRQQSSVAAAGGASAVNSAAHRSATPMQESLNPSQLVDSDDRVFSNRWNNGVVVYPVKVNAVTASSPILRNNASSSQMNRGGITATPARPTPDSGVMVATVETTTASHEVSVSSVGTGVHMSHFANVLEGTDRVEMITAKAGKLLGVSEALVGVDAVQRKELFRNLSYQMSRNQSSTEASSQTSTASEIIAGYRKKQRRKMKSRFGSPDLSSEEGKEQVLTSNLQIVTDDLGFLMPTRTYSFRTPLGRTAIFEGDSESDSLDSRDEDDDSDYFGSDARGFTARSTEFAICEEREMDLEMLGVLNPLVDPPTPSSPAKHKIQTQRKLEEQRRKLLLTQPHESTAESGSKQPLRSLSLHESSSAMSSSTLTKSSDSGSDKRLVKSRSLDALTAAEREAVAVVADVASQFGMELESVDTSPRSGVNRQLTEETSSLSPSFRMKQLGGSVKELYTKVVSLGRDASQRSDDSGASLLLLKAPANGSSSEGGSEEDECDTGESPPPPTIGQASQIRLPADALISALSAGTPIGESLAAQSDDDSDP